MQGNPLWPMAAWERSWGPMPHPHGASPRAPMRYGATATGIDAGSADPAMRALALPILLLIASSLPTVAADLDACAQPATRAFAGTVVPMVEVSGALAVLSTTCDGSGQVIGCGAAGCVATCTELGTYVVGTTYCGPFVGPGAPIVCSWMATRGNFHLLTVGFDVDGDGSITAADHAFTAGRMPVPGPVGTLESMTGASIWPDPNYGAWSIDNPSDETARMIAYPTSARANPNEGAGLIGCG